MKIILDGGPLNGDTDTIPDSCVIYRRRARGPNARYKSTDTDDANGHRIFKHWPPLKLGMVESNEGVHDA